MTRYYEAEALAGFGVLQYLSTAFLAAYMLVGVIFVGLTVLEPLLPTFFDPRTQAGLRGVSSIQAMSLAYDNPGIAVGGMAAAWPAFVGLRDLGWLSGRSIVLTATTLSTMGFAAIAPVVSSTDPFSDAQLSAVTRLMGMGAILGALYGLAFWAILRLWIWRRVARDPGIAETFQ
ncbi:MAG: hypothetical protein AAF848_14945 [Pseudomonadota bacterium]